LLCRANGVCRFADAIRLWVSKDAVRLCGSDACRLAGTNSEFLVTTEDWAQAASKLPPSATANSRVALRTAAPAATDALGSI
jgi:hypothetical protein